jgi:hypothetical protein
MNNKNTTNYNVNDLIRLFEKMSDPIDRSCSLGAYRALGALTAIIEGHINYGHNGLQAFEDAYDLQNQINRICGDLEKELAQQEVAA